MQDRRLRISFIEFLNSVPLGWGFTQGSMRGLFEILFDVPSQCAQKLENGTADVGLIPVIEYQRIPNLRIIPKIAISSKREVKSVVFLSRLPVAQISRIALDESSRTSVALLKILLAEHYGRSDIEFVVLPPQPHLMLSRCDAALLIGNPALQVNQKDLLVFDLAQEWHRFTGLPFVFAFWAGRPRKLADSDIGRFHDSLTEGLESLDEICQIYAARLNLAPAEIRSYLTRHLDYGLDRENLAGLQQFYQLADKHDLIDGVSDLRFY